VLLLVLLLLLEVMIRLLILTVVMTVHTLNPPYLSHHTHVSGFWGNTRFLSTTSKFRMNGTPNGYTHQISSPGWGFGGDELEVLSLSTLIAEPRQFL
jgi:hypothetical protein